MKPAVTVVYGRLAEAAQGRLPGWTLPFVVRIAERVALQAANGGPPLAVVAEGSSARVVDAGEDAFAREFGGLGRPGEGRLGAAALAQRLGGRP